MIGKTISHYKILEKLGEGGMGVVYKAEDTRLKRTVALKFLAPVVLTSEEEAARFANEARAAAALDHPNICTIHEIDHSDGQTFIAMGYVEGKSLRDKIASGPLNVDKAIDIAIQIAEGLREAHEKGIVHRDIKSGNIMVTGKGQAKIMDFGLAKMTKGQFTNKKRTTLGTAAYMSPEQARGEEVDQRTDIWSLGVVLYEMISGQLPFRGEYEQAIIYSILNEEPQPVTDLRPGLPQGIERILDKALAKDSDKRYQQAAGILADLKASAEELKLVAAGELPKPSIAVLPFTNLSADPEQQYFCDGMAEEIINSLAQVEGLRVVARTSAFSFRERQVDIREIGKELNVRTLLEGSVRKAGNRVRITAQLVSVADGYHLWSEKYDRDVGQLCCPEDIFAIQDEISLAIVDRLKVKLLGEEKAKLLKRHTGNLDAYDLYLKGRYFWNRRTEADIKKSIEYFNQAIHTDPRYALAYAGLADSYITLQDYSSVPPQQLHPKAKEAAEKSLEIDGTLAEAHTSMGQVAFRYWDWKGAEKEYKRALELNPNYPTAHHWYALLLMYSGRFDEAVYQIEKALALDSLSLVINRNVALVLFYARRYDQALTALQKTFELDPNFSLVHATLGRIYLQKSRYEEALAEAQKEKELLRGWDQQLESWIGITYARMGRKKEAREVLEDFIRRSEETYVSPYYIAELCFGLGEKESGFRWLEKAYQERDSCLLEIKVDPGFDSVRDDPRFKVLLKKVGLEE